MKVISSLVAQAGRVKPRRALSDEATAGNAETTSCILATASPSDAICHQSLSPADRVSTNLTEMSEREENKTQSQRPALSGIIHMALSFAVLYIMKLL